MMFGHNSFTHPFEAPMGWAKTYIPPKFGHDIEDLADPNPERRKRMQEKGVIAQRTFLATEIPMVSVKIDTTATNVSPDWVVSHQLPGWAESEPTKFTGYGRDWAQYQTMPYVENNKGTHCFTVVESNDSAVPVGTTYGNCPDDSDNGDENGEEPVEDEEKGTNWLLWGGMAAAAVVIFVM